jgi:hypothetical protein
LSGFEPTAVRGKWFEVKDLKHLATDAPKCFVVFARNVEFMKKIKKM